MVQPKSLIATMAEKYGIGSDQFFEVVQQTLMPSGASKAQTAAFLIVCNRYGFDPFLRQIFAFPSKGGGIVPVVSVDGWLDIMNSNPTFQGAEYEEIREGNKLIGGKVTIYRSDRPDHPIVHTEYFDECKRNTDPWNNMPRRMMNNRTFVQAIRRAFGVAGIMDPEEADQMREINITSESHEMGRATASSTENLSEKIKKGIGVAKKQIEARTPKVGEPKPPEPVQQPLIPDAVPPANVDVTTGELIDANGPLEDLGPDNDALLSDADRGDLLTILKSAPGATEAKQIAMKQKLVSCGYTNTKEVKYRHYAELMAWAKTTQF
jgi:phage recombination protein Bet